MITQCGDLNWHYITNSEFSLYTPENLIGADNLHPGINAGPVIASYLLQGLNTGSIDCKWPDENNFYSLTPEASYSPGSTVYTSLRTNNNVKKLIFTDLDGTIGFGAMSYRTFYKLGTLNAIYANDPIYKNVMFMAMANEWTGWKAQRFIIKIDGYDMYIAAAGNDETGSASVTITNISCIDRLEFDLDTLNT